MLYSPVPITAAELGFVGPEFTAAEIDGELGAAWWVGPAENPPVYLGLTLEGGTVLECAPGNVVDRGDVASLDDIDVADSLALAWTCSPADDDL
jgi:hypothetical protein